MENISRNVIYLIVAALIAVGSAAIAFQAYAHSSDDYRSSSSSYGPMGMGGGMMGYGSGMMTSAYYYDDDDHDDMMEYGYCPGMEYMEKHYYDHSDDYMYKGTPVTINGVVVDTVNGKNVLVVQTDSNDTVMVVVLPMYVDNSNGYMVSGFWLADQIASAVSSGETVNIGVTGVYNSEKGVVVAFTIDALGKSLTAPMYYMHPEASS